MFELLVPPGQLDRLKGDRKVYDLEVRPGLMAQTIQELQDADIEPEMWNIQGLERQADCERSSLLPDAEAGAE